MTNATNTIEAVQRVIADRLSIGEPEPDEDLIEEGLLDSLMLIELILDLERAFSVSLPLETIEIDDFRSASSIAALVDRLGAAA